jgi:hypothetical protein
MISCTSGHMYRFKSNSFVLDFVDYHHHHHHHHRNFVFNFFRSVLNSNITISCVDFMPSGRCEPRLALVGNPLGQLLIFSIARLVHPPSSCHSYTRSEFLSVCLCISANRSTRFRQRLVYVLNSICSSDQTLILEHASRASSTMLSVPSCFWCLQSSLQ